MSMPTGFAVHGSIYWHADHGDPFTAAEDLAEHLENSDYTVVYEPQTDEHLILSEEGDG